MPTFTKKNISLPTDRVCFRLKQVRETKGMTIEALAAKTKIMKEYLVALEECRFADLKCSPLYQRQFIKKYLTALDVDPEPYLSQFCLEEMSVVEKHPSQNRHHSFSNLPNLIRWGSVSIIAGLCLVYLGLQVRRTLEPPQLVLSSPEEGLILNNNNLAISGTTDPEVKVAINGQAVMSDELGRFNQAITLQPGINTVVITAEKKHGKTTRMTRHIIFRDIPQVGRADSNGLDPKG